MQWTGLLWQASDSRPYGLSFGNALCAFVGLEIMETVYWIDAIGLATDSGLQRPYAGFLRLAGRWL